MPPRRSHNKSRNGCTQCKQRRVKCNEKGPICQQCVKRELQCSFSTPDRDAASATSQEITASPASTVPLPTSHPRSEPSFQLTPAVTPIYKEPSDNVVKHSDRILELELMHHYSTSAYISCVGLRAHTETVDVWQKFVPSESLKHEFLLNGLLAFAALHIAKLTRQPNPKVQSDITGSFLSSSSFYFQKALEYQNLAFESFHGVLQNVTPDNCSAVFGFSILTMLFAIAIPGIEDGGQGGPSTSSLNSMQSIFTLFEYLKGLSSIIEVSKESLHAGPFRVLLGRYDDYTTGNWRITNADVAQTLNKLTILNNEFNASSGEFGTNVELSKFATNARAISLLEFCFAKQEIPSDEAQAQAVKSSPDIDRGYIVGWLGMAGGEFVSQLRQSDSLSLLIFAHWAILLDDLEDFWWTHNSGKVLVAEIASVLHTGGDVWKERTRWARKKVGLP
ncbi:hypothetical protein PV11_09094 [Exophiala sideris]|uniref:Zn(2)-C6 fungal-type domain-containing protein n=1 Tax=Exophiala sideris TaxID=1016849 RepID=A0A0D1YQK2_9EURO|nr:hypothetical protein PV11_09094 [Exophiala sideris]